MFAYPVKEIEKIHGKKHSWKDEVLETGENLLSGIQGELFDINVEFAVGDAAECGFVIRGLPVTYDVEKQLLSCKGENAPLKPVDGKIRLRILVDRVSIEIFGNDGRVYMPMGAILADENKTLEVFTKGGDVKLTSLDVHELRSIWRK